MKSVAIREKTARQNVFHFGRRRHGKTVGLSYERPEGV